MKGRNGSTLFLPLTKKGGFQSKVKSDACLTEDQAKQVHDKIESGEVFRIRKIMQHSNVKFPKQVKERKDINQYEKALLSDRNVIKNNLQMEQWSILSDNIVYVRLEDNDIMNGIDMLPNESVCINCRLRMGLHRTYDVCKLCIMYRL